MAPSLATLSLDIICEITDYLNARDISSLSSSGDKRLRVMLHEAPGVLRLVQPTLRLRHGLKLPKLALEFRYLRSLTLGTERSYYGGSDKLPDWKIDALPKSLTSLRVCYPFSFFPFINFPMAALAVPLSNGLASIDWIKAVTSWKLKKLVEGDPSFDPAQLFFNLSLILPQLNTLMVFGEFNTQIQYLSPIKLSSSWVRPFLQGFPSSLHSFGSDWLTLDDVITSIPHSITDLTLRGDYWIPNSLTGLSTLVSRLRSLDVTDSINLPLSGPDEVSRTFETSFLSANIGLDVLTRFKVLETLILKNKLTAEMSLALPSSLTYLHVNTLTRGVSIEVLPRGLQTFGVDWLDFGFDVPRSRRLPPGLTSLYLPTTDRNLADNLVFPQSLVHLALPNLGMRDDQFHLLPKSLRSLKLNRLILTGFLLNPNTECVTLETISQSSCNIPKSFYLTTQNKPSFEISYLPPSLTSIDPSLSFAQIPLESLPPGLNCILRDYPLGPNQLDRLPIGLRHLRIDSQMPVKWRYFSQLPKSLTVFRGGIVEFDTMESLEEVISAFGSAARFEIPETFQRHALSLFGPSASIKPRAWKVRFSPLYFSMLPDTVNTIVARSFDIPQHETPDWHLTSFPKGITSISIADVPQQNKLLQAIPTSVKHLYWTQGSLIARPGSLKHLSTLSSLEMLSIGCFHINDLLNVTLPKSLTSLSIYQSSMQFNMLKQFPFPPNLTYLALYDRLIAHNNHRPIQREDYLCLKHLPKTLKGLVIRAPIYDCSCVPLLPPSLEYFINGKEEKLASFKRALANQQARTTANWGISLLRLQNLDGSAQPLEES